MMVLIPAAPYPEGPERLQVPTTPAVRAMLHNEARKLL